MKKKERRKQNREMWKKAIMEQLKNQGKIDSRYEQKLNQVVKTDKVFLMDMLLFPVTRMLEQMPDYVNPNVQGVRPIPFTEVNIEGDL